jgi:hypothetical protein
MLRRDRHGILRLELVGNVPGEIAFMTFTKSEQTKHRKAFIDECRQKAWGAACHADWISKGVDDILAHYQKLQAEDRALEEAIKAAEVPVDYHTVEDRNKRKSMQERRNTLAQQMKLVSENAQRGQQSLQQLYASMESNLALAKHAEEWEWKEAKTHEKAV